MAVKAATRENLANLAEKVHAEDEKIRAQVAAITVPANVSELTNDSDFQTGEQVAATVAAAEHLKRKKVAGLDEIDLSAADAAQYIYLVPKSDAENGDSCDEYMVLDGALEKVGNWAVDLSGYATKEEVTAKISSVYKPCGSVAFNALPALDAEHLGAVVNVTDKFTTTMDFLEGAGKEIPAGTNVVVVACNDKFYKDKNDMAVDRDGKWVYVLKDETAEDTAENRVYAKFAPNGKWYKANNYGIMIMENGKAAELAEDDPIFNNARRPTPYAYDVLAGTVDLSGYVTKETGKGLSSNDFTDEEKLKLAGIEFTTDEEFDAMLTEVFGAAEPPASV